MPWPADKVKLDRVRSLMKAQDLSALVCRAPDNVVYLTNYWCMKGYDAVIFPCEGEPTLIALEPQQAESLIEIVLGISSLAAAGSFLVLPA